MTISFVDIQQAAEDLKGIVLHTPLIKSPYLSQLIQGEVFLKLENLQVTGSFKSRGAYIKLKRLTPVQREKGIIAMSAGNHAQGVAYHAAHMGIPTTIVMPEGTPLAKVERTRQYGAKVILKGASLAESEQYALPIAEQEDLTIIHPYNDEAIIAGQATVGLEMFEDHPFLDTVIVPIGGGGLASGVALARDALAPKTALIGVQSEHCTAMTARLYPDRSLPMKAVTGQTLAEGIAVKAPGQITANILQSRLADIVVVSEPGIEAAIDLLILHQKIVAEGAGAAGIAALSEHAKSFYGKKVAVVICGGNIDSRILSSVLMRGLVHRHQLIQLKVEIVDAAGILTQVSKVIGKFQGNIIEIHHQRWFNTTAVKMSDLDIIVEIRDQSQGEEIVNALNNAGFPTEVEYL